MLRQHIFYVDIIIRVDFISTRCDVCHSTSYRYFDILQMTHDPSLARDAMAVMVACEHVDNEMQQFLTLFSCIIWGHTVKSFIQNLHNDGSSKIFESGAAACIRLITVPRWGASG